jgi:hypothetical protein
MHRDGETKWHMNPVEAEQRRRLWWILYTHDRYALHPTLPITSIINNELAGFKTLSYADPT